MGLERWSESLLLVRELSYRRRRHLIFIFPLGALPLASAALIFIDGSRIASYVTEEYQLLYTLVRAAEYILDCASDIKHNSKANMEDVLDEVVSSEDLKVSENYLFFEILNISTLKILPLGYPIWMSDF
jgi:hypothetical protein